MSLGGNTSNSNQQSRSLTAGERQSIYNQAMSNINTPGANAYVAPTQKTLSRGDYGALQQSLTDGYTAPLDYAKGKDIQNFNNSAGAKGIWSSGLAVKGENDINQGYAGQYAKAGADATAKRYDLQSAENSQGNAMGLETALQRYNAAWRPADFRSGVWNGTGGTVSSGGSSSMGFSI